MSAGLDSAIGDGWEPGETAEREGQASSLEVCDVFAQCGTCDDWTCGWCLRYDRPAGAKERGCKDHFSGPARLAMLETQESELLKRMAGLKAQLAAVRADKFIIERRIRDGRARK